MLMEDFEDSLIAEDEDILENTTFGSNSTKEVFTTDEDNEVAAAADTDNSDDERRDSSPHQRFSNILGGGDDAPLVLAESRALLSGGNIFSKLKETEKRQDEIQRKVMSEAEEWKEVNLLKADRDLEELAKQIITRSMRLVKDNRDQLMQVESKIECVTRTLILSQVKAKNLELCERFYFSVPAFIVKNV